MEMDETTKNNLEVFKQKCLAFAEVLDTIDTDGKECNFEFEEHFLGTKVTMKFRGGRNYHVPVD